MIPRWLTDVSFQCFGYSSSFISSNSAMLAETGFNFNSSSTSGWMGGKLFDENFEIVNLIFGIVDGDPESPSLALAWLCCHQSETTRRKDGTAKPFKMMRLIWSSPKLYPRTTRTLFFLDDTVFHCTKTESDMAP